MTSAPSSAASVTSRRPVLWELLPEQLPAANVFSLEEVPELDHVGTVEQLDELVDLLEVAAERVKYVLNGQSGFGFQFRLFRHSLPLRQPQACPAAVLVNELDDELEAVAGTSLDKGVELPKVTLFATLL